MGSSASIQKSTDGGRPPEVRCAQNHSLLRQYFSTRAEPSLRSLWLQATSRRHSSTASPSPLPAGRLGYVPAWRGWLRRFDRSDRLLALECLDRVGLMDLAMRRADTLSGGQQQRVAIARALAQCPTLIVADEPVASLDPSTSTGVLDLLHGIARSEGVAVVCSLHQVHLARAYADRIVGLSSGRVVFDLPAARFDENAFQRLYRSHLTDNVI